MNASFSTAGLKTLFRYPLQGREWGRKMLYLALFWLGGFIIPVVPWLFAWGYSAEVLRRSAAGRSEDGLPEWGDWSRLLMDGLRIFGAGVIASILPVGLMIVGMTYYVLVVPLGTMLAQRGNEMQFLFMMLSGMFVLFLTTAFSMLLSIAAGLVSGPAITHMLVKESFGALFQVNAWWRVLRANLGGYLVALFLIGGLYYAMVLVSSLALYTIVLACLFPLVLVALMPYMSLFAARLFGQVYREAEVEMPAGSPLPDAAI